MRFCSKYEVCTEYGVRNTGDSLLPCILSRPISCASVSHAFGRALLLVHTSRDNHAAACIYPEPWVWQLAKNVIYIEVEPCRHAAMYLIYRVLPTRVGLGGLRCIYGVLIPLAMKQWATVTLSFVCSLIFKVPDAKSRISQSQISASNTNTLLITCCNNPNWWSSYYILNFVLMSK